MEEASLELELPGFRFHPTEEELVDFYLQNMLHGKKLRYDVIRFLNIYHHDPSELPGLARLGEREWYFFVPRDRKHGSGGRPNRTTKNGFWKATGSDRRIVSLSDHKRVIGLRKTLVFYEGRAPRGHKTDWVMNEYRVPDNSGSPKDMVLCKIYKKATSFKVLEQRAAMEEAIKISNQSSVDIASAYTCPHDATLPPSEDNPHDATLPPSEDNKVVLKWEKDEEEVVQIRTEEAKGHSGTSSQMWPRFGRESLPKLLVPRFPVSDWTQDSFWTQFNSPWLSNLLATPHANTLNFLAN